MKRRASYREFYPRWHRTRMSTYWWLERKGYIAFILRELSSIFVAWFVVYLLLLVRAVSRGESNYHEFMSWSAHPWTLLLNLVSLLFVVFHSITWFKLAPQATVVHFQRKRLPGTWIAAANYLAWALVSALVAWVLIGG